VIGIDTGGTFTDIAAVIDGELKIHKLLSTPRDPAAAVLAGLDALLGEQTGALVTYSSTVATNALLERRGARVALVTNAGFEDLIEIGRQNRSDIYALAPTRPEPLVAREMRFGVRERTWFDGQIAQELDGAEIEALLKSPAAQAESFAVCLLHSYANPASETRLADELEKLKRPLSVSHRLLPEYREFERLSTTVINAYVAPLMVEHLGHLERNLRAGRLRIMQSDGNAIGVALARQEPVRTILSGPAAGVVGAANLARAFGVNRFITFDMGGTSTDVSLFDGRATVRALSYPAGYPVKTPVIDIHTVGAGGGSLARIDASGSLKVGPQSAGADPGPACYGKGTEPAVTDADLIAGRLVASNFLGGRMTLDAERARGAISGLAQAMGVGVEAAARGVIEVVNANMARAIRLITIERGFDPRDFALLAFGGAGPMHACELARELGIGHIILPRNPGLLCAWGALSAPLGREYSLTVREGQPRYRDLLRRAEPLRQRALAEMKTEGVGAKPRLALFAEMRYRGQSYEIKVPLTPDFRDAFHLAHERTFGYAARDAALEVVNLRLNSSALEYEAPLRRYSRSARRPVPIGTARVLVGRGSRRVPIYDRESLSAGARLPGPLLIVELSATAYVAPEFVVRADDYGNLHLESA
jgi:N-methylhydantoinase A